MEINKITEKIICPPGVLRIDSEFSLRLCVSAVKRVFTGEMEDEMSDSDKTEGAEFENPGSSLKHQITCSKCGNVYEIRYLSETCRMVDGEGYLCRNCDTVLDIE